MDNNEIERYLLTCPDLAGLDEAILSELFWRGTIQTLEAGTVVYAEGAPLDNTFGLLISGALIIERGGVILGGIFEHQAFGEMAYFNHEHTRTATIRVGSPVAVIVKIRMTAEELRSEKFLGLSKCLALQTWQKFVHTAQNDAGGVHAPPPPS